MVSRGENRSVRVHVHDQDVVDQRAADAVSHSTEDLLDRVISSTRERDEFLKLMCTCVVANPETQLNSEQQVLELVNLTLAKEFKLALPLTGAWAKASRNVASTLWKNMDCRSRLIELWKRLKAEIK